MVRILIVGGGLSGAVAAWKLRKSLGTKVNIECWEYLNDVGGRLAITSELSSVADVATQYLSFDLQRAAVMHLHDVLAHAGLLHEPESTDLGKTTERPTGPEWKLFYVPAGTASVVQFLFKQAQATLRTNCCVDLCSLDAENWKWCKSGGSRRTDSFDAVIFCNGPTHPGCERMDNIWGEWQDVIDPFFRKALRQVTWSSCYVITLFLSPECMEYCDGFFGAGDTMTHKAPNDDLVHYIVYESRKRAKLQGVTCSTVVLVCHTTAEAMWYYKRSECVQVVQHRVLVDYLQIPSRKAHGFVNRAHSRCWGKSQVTRSISEILDCTTSQVSCNPIDAPPLALCGDYFLGSSCTDTIISALDAAEAIACGWKDTPAAEQDRHEMHPKEGRSKHGATTGY